MIPAETLTCEECGEDVTLGRSEHRTLRATCGCDGLAVEVSELVPTGWSP